MTYSIPPGADLTLNWECHLICLARPDSAERPVFSIRP